jgi:outer membrane lipoprotein-sorting protein
LLVLAAAGCAPKKAPPVETVIPLTSDIREKMDRKDAMGKNLNGLARITLRSPEGIHSTACAIAVRFPSSLRLETIPPLGPPDLFLVVHGDMLKAFLPGKGKFYVGRPTRASLSRFIPLPLDVHAVIPLLLGIPPRLDPKEGVTLRGVKEEDLYRIDTLYGGRRLRALWLDPSKNEVTRFEAFGSDGALSYTVLLEDYRMVDGTAIPERVEFRFGGGDAEATSLRIRYSDLRLSTGEEDKALFDLDVPPGITPIQLD